MNQEELNKIVRFHLMWTITNAEIGSRANLSGADLSGAVLAGANLESANLQDADLTGADLEGANLCNAKNIDKSFDYLLQKCKGINLFKKQAGFKD